MERNALNRLIEWNNDKDKKPLIIWGARQTGKTYLVLELFAKKYYQDKYLYIDFKVEDDIRDFCLKTANATKIIEYLSLWSGKDINKDTLLIFDEIQECSNIISSLKYFCQDYREIPVVATGSMVRIKIQRELHKRGISNNQFLFPVGKIDQINIYPLTFEEFLMNINLPLYKKVKDAYKNKVRLDDNVHKLAMDCVYKYLLIGGMPEALSKYIEDTNLLKTREILKSLYDNYLAYIGMFSYQSGIDATSFITNDRENILSGIFFENFVSNELVASGNKLFYWRGKNNAELEFIVEPNNKLYPIDVKKEEVF